MNMQLRSALGESRWRRFLSNGVAGKSDGSDLVATNVQRVRTRTRWRSAANLELPVPIVNSQMAANAIKSATNAQTREC
jgi:hypothetical protein